MPEKLLLLREQLIELTSVRVVKDISANWRNNFFYRINAQPISRNAGRVLTHASPARNTAPNPGILSISSESGRGLITTIRIVKVFSADLTRVMQDYKL